MTVKLVEGAKVGFEEAWSLSIGAVVKVANVVYVIQGHAEYPRLQHEKTPRRVITLVAYGKDVPNTIYATASWRGWPDARFQAENTRELNGRYKRR